MDNNENLRLAREQLRKKNAELKKHAAEKERFDDRIKNITMVNHKRVNDLENKIAEKDEEIKYYQGITNSLLSRKPTKNSKTDALIKEQAPSQTPPIVELKKVPVHDPRLLKTIAELEIKNRGLASKIEKEINESAQLTREKSILIKEIRRLNEDSSKQINEKAVELNSRFKGRVKNQQDLISQPNEDASFPQSDERIHAELDKIKLEKDRLEEDLIKEKRRHKTHLQKEIQQLSQDWGVKLKKVRLNRKKTGQISDGEDIIDEIMGDDKAPYWVVTYADMTTLLLTFFILYYSISSSNLQKFQEVLLGEETASISVLELIDSVKIKESLESFTGLRSDNILTDMKDMAETEVYSSSMEVNTNDEAKIIVRVSGETLFESGTATLLRDSKPALDEIARILKKYPLHKIHIQGHTDDEEISTDRFPSNWELSSARASSALRFFLNKNIHPKRITATGYADLFPIASNQTEQGRMKNRRVEFVLEKEK